MTMTTETKPTLTWETAPEGLTAKMVGDLVSQRPVWVRRHLRHLAKQVGPRSLRWSKREVMGWWVSLGQ
jgi:hypothetical protein